MNKALATLILFFLNYLITYSQVEPDTSAKVQDSLPIVSTSQDTSNLVLPDSLAPVAKIVILDSGLKVSPFNVAGEFFAHNLAAMLQENAHFNFLGNAQRRRELRRIAPDTDPYFYVILGLFFYFGIIRTIFSRYVNNLFAIFLRITLKQQQLREQVLQAPLPSILLNILFLLTGGFYTSLLLDFYGVNAVKDFWIQTSYCVLLLAVVYLGKLVFLKAIGWTFGITKATDTYIFVVFLVNKMLGIFLLPFLVLIVFQPSGMKQVFVTLSLIVILVLFFYRFVFTYKPMRTEIKINFLHFFLYICAFEIAPLLLIYKVLLRMVETSN